MNVKVIVDEKKRGCGYRHEGGLYLVTDARVLGPCGKLPLPLEVCPTCGGGIHPARAWTWVNARALFDGVACLANKGEGCPGCVLDKPPLRMGLLWVGERFYSTPGEFLREGEAQGFSRRIPAVPKDFELGTTWVLFAHRKAIYTPQITDQLEPIYKSGAFFAFKPERIEYITRVEDSQEHLESIEHRGITLVRLQRTNGAEAGEEQDGLFENVEEVPEEQIQFQGIEL
jgi:hypothetical protein